MAAFKRTLAAWMPWAGWWLMAAFTAMFVYMAADTQAPFTGANPAVLARVSHNFDKYVADMPGVLIAFADGAPYSLHYGRAVIGRYAHMIMAVPWCLLAFALLNGNLRKRKPHVHRRLGYAFVALDLVMMVGVLDIIRTKAGFYYVESQALRTNGLMAAIMVAFLGSAFAAVRAARDRDIPAHRRFALHHIAIGHGVSSQRLFLALWQVYCGVAAAMSGAAPAPRGDRDSPESHSRQLRFGELVLLGVVVNCTLVEVWHHFAHGSAARSGSAKPPSVSAAAA